MNTAATGKQASTHDIEEVFFNAGLSYTEFLARRLEDRGIRCSAPIEGLSTGQQKAWYLEHT